MRQKRLHFPPKPLIYLSVHPQNLICIICLLFYADGVVVNGQKMGLCQFLRQGMNKKNCQTAFQRGKGAGKPLDINVHRRKSQETMNEVNCSAHSFTESFQPQLEKNRKLTKVFYDNQMKLFFGSGKLFPASVRVGKGRVYLIETEIYAA